MSAALEPNVTVLGRIVLSRPDVWVERALSSSAVAPLEFARNIGRRRLARETTPVVRLRIGT